ncbi:hypothetical protein [Hyphomicrobium sp.]|uniref:hypothetical protein n=1 Tax=Hyphomicrobium sp. TaxID=82 RepID=UPI002D7A2B61|nr:hypothetical protein [Hyphomicrobium sp.]HET6390780.1 hypothetical protein [Hyphomicrobium sp.]
MPSSLVIPAEAQRIGSRRNVPNPTRSEDSLKLVVDPGLRRDDGVRQSIRTDGFAVSFKSRSVMAQTRASARCFVLAVDREHCQILAERRQILYDDRLESP